MSCSLKTNSTAAEMIKEAKLIAWDEAPMTHRRCIEVVDNTLRDIMGTVDSRLEHLPFGGKLVLFGGDLRQLLPVITAGSRSTVVNACITKSSMRQHVTKKKLTVNMRERMARLQGTLERHASTPCYAHSCMVTA